MARRPPSRKTGANSAPCCATCRRHRHTPQRKKTAAGLSRRLVRWQTLDPRRAVCAAATPLRSGAARRENSLLCARGGEVLFDRHVSAHKIHTQVRAVNHTPVLLSFPLHNKLSAASCAHTESKERPVLWRADRDGIAVRQPVDDDRDHREAESDDEDEQVLLERHELPVA